MFIGILSALPIVNVANCCCLWIIGGGVLTAYIERQNNPTSLTVGRGARAGLLAGVIAALVWVCAAATIDVVLAPLQDRMITRLLRNAQDIPPEARQWLEAMASGASPLVRYVVGFSVHLVAGVVFASFGGMIGAVLFRPDVPPPIPPVVPRTPPSLPD